MKIINKLLITLIAITSIFNFMILDNYNIYAEKNSTYELDPYSQESIEYINELKGNVVKKSISNQMYNDIYCAMINLDDSIDLSSYGPPSSTEAFNIRKKVLDDHPEIFYFKHEGSVYWSNGKLEFKYIDSKSVVKNMISELDTKVDIILNKYIDKSMSQMEKLIAIHDYIVLNTTYLKTTYCYDSYGVIVKGRGVCQGYAESMKLLLNRIGIECIYVSSPEMNHGWNIVNIDGENYQLDATWDDPVPNRDGAIRYMYLALSDYEMSKDHNWDRSQYPICNSDKYKYMREMDYVVNGINNRYYANIEENWNIYKIKKDGTNKEKIVNEPATPLYIKDRYLYYKEYFSGITKKIFINDEILTEQVKVTSINLNKTSLTLLKGESEKLKATINPSNATNKNVTWKSSNTNIAKVDNTGKVTVVGVGTAKITATTEDGKKVATCHVTGLNNIKFSDIKGHWAESQINKFISDGYINGYHDNTFRPDNAITRAEFVKIFNKYFGLNKKSNKTFSDTSKHWAKDEIDIAITCGIVSGYPDNTFRPDELITREQVAKIISSYKKLRDNNFDKISKYNDFKEVSSWAKSSIEGVLECGYMNGYPNNTFRSKNNITRAEAIVTLNRIIK